MLDNLLDLFGYIILFAGVFAVACLMEWLWERAERRRHQRRVTGSVRHDWKDLK